MLYNRMMTVLTIVLLQRTCNQFVLKQCTLKLLLKVNLDESIAISIIGEILKGFFF